MLGLRPGDAKIFRNAGARVTDDLLRSLILATNLLGVDRVCVVQHTDCAVAKSSNEKLQSKVGELRGADASSWDFLAIGDQEDVLVSDVKKIEACELLPPDVKVGGFIYDVMTGKLREL
jgi:carbonic anhydrase